MKGVSLKQLAPSAVAVLAISTLVIVSPAGAEGQPSDTQLCNDGDYIQWYTRNGDGNKYFECITGGSKTRQLKNADDPVTFGVGPEIIKQPFTTEPDGSVPIFFGGRLAYGVKTPECDAPDKNRDSINAERDEGCGAEKLTMELGDEVARSISAVDLRVKCYANDTQVTLTADVDSGAMSETESCNKDQNATLRFFEGNDLSFRSFTISADSGFFGIKPGISDTKFHLTEVVTLAPNETLALNENECVIKNTSTDPVGVEAEVVEQNGISYCNLKVRASEDQSGFARFQVATTLPVLTQDDLPGQFDGDGPTDGVNFVDAPVCTQDPIDESDTDTATQTCVLGIYYPAILDADLTITPDASPPPPTATGDALDRVALFDVWTNDPSWR